jgi:hypothetical protein
MDVEYLHKWVLRRSTATSEFHHLDSILRVSHKDLSITKSGSRLSLCISPLAAPREFNIISRYTSSSHPTNGAAIQPEGAEEGLFRVANSPRSLLSNWVFTKVALGISDIPRVR